MSQSIALVLGTTLFAQHAFPSEQIEIKATLSGYNLIWPTKRCCAFELSLNGSGRGTVTIHDARGSSPKDRAVELKLSAAQVDALLKVITSNDFFALPSSVGDMPIDDDERRMEIKVGPKSNKVDLNGWPIAQHDLKSLDQRRRDQVDHAGRVWVAIRHLVESPEVSLP